MASADLWKELECPICLTTYRDPVTLGCGHNFCWLCIDGVLEAQEGSGGYSCPECREKFQEQPALHRNTTLCNIVEYFLSTKPNQEDTGVSCTQCLHTWVPAVTSCLLCEASLCEGHLSVHSKSLQHILCDPTNTLESRTCSVHKKILGYYYTEDIVRGCVYCLVGENTGHKMMSLDEAYEKKKKKLMKDLENMMVSVEEAEKRVQSLKERRNKLQDGDTERVTALISDLRRWLKDQEMRVQNEILRQEEKMSRLFEDVIQQLEMKEEELSMNMCHIEELCNMIDALTVLQESGTGDTDEGVVDRENQLHDGGDLADISYTLSDIINEATGGICLQGAASILLDVNTAENYLHISNNRKFVSWTHIDQNRPDIPVRFQEAPQVMSVQSFSSGEHYWEVDIDRSGYCRIGMCYSSIDRRGDQSRIGYSQKSWCLYINGSQESALHDSCKIPLSTDISGNRIRISLDYEAGKISFYTLCDTVRHLHTFTATFTEPLHAALCVGYLGSIKISGGC